MASNVGTSAADSADVTTEALLTAAAALAPVNEDQMEVDPQQQLTQQLADDVAAAEGQLLRPTAWSPWTPQQLNRDGEDSNEDGDVVVRRTRHTRDRAEPQSTNGDAAEGSNRLSSPEHEPPSPARPAPRKAPKKAPAQAKGAAKKTPRKSAVKKPLSASRKLLGLSEAYAPKDRVTKPMRSFNEIRTANWEAGCRKWERNRKKWVAEHPGQVYPKGKPKEPEKRRETASAKALREIRHYQKQVTLNFPKATFRRVCNEIALDINGGQPLRWQQVALDALQEGTEAVLVGFFENCVIACTHAKRVTIRQDDMAMVRRIMSNVGVTYLEGPPASA